MKKLTMGLYYTSDKKEAARREDIVAKATEISINEFKANDPTL